ncbi:type IX secretion system outer membrane channel protein PorV [Geofilum rhodophaeum]|uniref:type IX secretion system outer membrane channel protein PorV n=1 Tax=Geofilum rhodophaeum TaxID=1965019 RepID=UPI000B51FAD9|nr:type IX secretion system outer membrane channel protein PorV [Geofilum rhodophaeum]
MKRILKSLCALALLTLLSVAPALGQDYSDLSGQVNIINTAVPFIGIAPDSRAGAMGNAGVATSPDVNSQHWNPAKFAFIDSNMGASMSYTPWLRKLVNDINMYYLTGFMRLDEMQTLSASLRYFTLGNITYTTSINDPGYIVNPNEFAFDVAYSRLLSEKFSGAVAFRYIRSDLNSMQEDMQPGNSFAADLAFYYRTPVNLMGESSELAAGINVSNIGNKISYDEVNKLFIPTNMRLGVALDSELDSYNRLVFTLDLNKLLVPTPGFSPEEGTANDYAQKYNNMSVTKAMFQSFSDAPGGMEEELQEITYSLGAEYWYANQFALRAGYFHEHELKGNRKHFTAGIGIKFNMMTLDASYIIPVVADNPLANTIRFSLGIDLDQLSNR